MIRVQLIGKKEALDIWSTKPVNAAMKSTLARVAKTAISTASTEIRNIYTIKKSDLDPRMNLTIQGTDQAAITISGKGISLSYFNARQFTVNKTLTRGRKDGKAVLKTKTRSKAHAFQGVEVEVLKGRKTQLKSAFMAQMKSGHIGVMHRLANGKLMKRKNKAAIIEKKVISLTSMILNAKVQPDQSLCPQKIPAGQGGKALPGTIAPTTEREETINLSVGVSARNVCNRARPYDCHAWLPGTELPPR